MRFLEAVRVKRPTAEVLSKLCRPIHPEGTFMSIWMLISLLVIGFDVQRFYSTSVGGELARLRLWASLFRLVSQIAHMFAVCAPRGHDGMSYVVSRLG